jgi:hypothetical protein
MAEDPAKTRIVDQTLFGMNQPLFHYSFSPLKPQKGLGSFCQFLIDNCRVRLPVSPARLA